MKRASSARALMMVLGVGVMTGCTWAQLPDAVFKCEADQRCAQAGFECLSDGFCHAKVDAGGGDAGFDAGVDAGVDAGFDAGVDDAGVDAGLDDAGLDAGMDDAGFDAGFDAGVDAGVDAGTDDAGFDAGCVPTGAIDEPDPAGLDVDCDGFDGDLIRAVFVDPVNGLDSNVGTRASPVRTFAHASTLGKSQLYLATGTYVGDVTLADAVGVYGGYNPAGLWTRSTTKSLMTGALLAAPADAGRVVLELLEVQGPLASVPGEASVAVTFRNASSTSRITSCRFVGGTGANGSDGAAAPSVNPGNSGGAGLSGDLGGDGGLGGAGANCGDAGSSPTGFVGGSSGDDGLGQRGLDVTKGGAGGAATACDGGVFAGLDGGDGLVGDGGTQSTTRPADPPSADLGSIVASQWQGVSLGTWSPALSGRPGGGGGAGGGLVNLGGGVLLARGGGAGGGGSGGCGGRSGTAGQAGGASIALVLFNSSPTLSDVQLVSTQAGNGGAGGSGGAGGPGGSGGAGQIGSSVVSGTAGVGGRGAAGGVGGAGRQGPGGWGGPIVGLFCGGTSTPVLDGTTTWTPGSPGVAGTGDPNGQSGGQPASGYSANCP